MYVCVYIGGEGTETGLLFAAYSPGCLESHSVDQVGSHSDPPACAFQTLNFFEDRVCSCAHTRILFCFGFFFLVFVFSLPKTGFDCT